MRYCSVQSCTGLSLSRSVSDRGDTEYHVRITSTYLGERSWSRADYARVYLEKDVPVNKDISNDTLEETGGVGKEIWV